VVHTNGIHHIALVACTCQGHENITIDLIYAGWVPTSFVRVRTIFTAAVLLYHELRRLSRLWRWVKKLRWAGYGQRVGQLITPKPGELGNYCLACPQVGFNVAENWKADPNRWVYRRVVTVDGNFTADHVRQPLAADDLWLSDGLGMTTRNSEYKAFLQSAQERKTVSVNNSGSFGIGSLA